MRDLPRPAGDYQPVKDSYPDDDWTRKEVKAAE